MQHNKLDEHFNAFAYVDELIEEMGMQNEDPIKLEGLKKAMVEALMRQLFQAAEDNVEPETMDMVMEDLKDEEDPGYILRQMVLTSPGAQVAMLLALDEFRENTLEAYNKLKI